MNVTAGVGGPGLVVYALATGWTHSGFAATAQVQFAVLGIASLALEAGAAHPRAWSAGSCWSHPWRVGLVAGNLLASRIDGAEAMRGVIVIAAVGACLALAQGIRAL